MSVNKVHFKRLGWPQTTDPQLVIAIPSVDIGFDVQSKDLVGGGVEYTTKVAVQIEDTPPVGAAYLRVRVSDNSGRRIASTRFPAVVGSRIKGVIPNVTSKTDRKIRAAWVGLNGVPGPESVEITIEQPGTDDPSNPGGDLTITSESSLILDPINPLTVGTILDMSPAKFSGGVAPVSISSYLQQSNSSSGTSPTTSSHVPGDNIGSGLIGKYVRAVTTATDSDSPPVSLTSYSAWTTTPIVEDDPVTAPVVNSWRWVEVADDEYLAIFNLGPMTVGSYAGMNGSGLRVQWARKPANPNSTTNWEVMSPYNYNEGQEPVITGSGQEWRPNTLSTDTSGNWIRPARRMPVYRAPDDYNFLIRYSEDGGANWSPPAEVNPTVSNPKFPWLNIDPPVGSGDYWKPIEFVSQSAPGFYGEGHQWFRCLATGKTHSSVLALGDMCHIRRSDDFGATWYHLDLKGCKQFGWNTGAFDLTSADRFCAVGHSAWYANTDPYDDYQGIWQSKDGGKTATLVLPLPTTTSNGWHQKVMQVDPHTIANAVSARRWWYLHCIDGGSSQLYRSDTGGDTWAKVGAEHAVSKFNKVWALIVDPNDDGTLYLAGQVGLYKNTNYGVGDSTTWTRVGTGLPTTRIRNLWISDDGATMYACAENNGVYKTTNGNASSPTWSKILDNTNAIEISVDFKTSGGHTIYVRTSAGAPNDMYVSTDSGGSFSANIPRTPMAGYAGDSYYSRISNGGSFQGSLVHPTTAGVYICQASSRFWKTTNKGSSFADSSMGLTGVNAANNLWMFTLDPSTNSRFCFGVQDLGFVEVNNNGAGGLKHSNPSQDQQDDIPGVGGNLATYGAHACCILPSGRMIVGAGGGGAYKSIFIKDPGQNSWTGGANSPSRAVIAAIRFHPTSTNVVVAGPYKSTSNGDMGTWNALPSSMKFLGMHPDGTGYFYNSPTTIYRSADWHTSSPTFTQFYSISTGNLKSAGVDWMIVKPDPFDNQAIYTVNASGDFVRVKNTGTTFGAAVVTNYNLRPTTGLTVADWAFGVCMVAADYRVNGLVYATTTLPGVPCIWRGQISGNNITWTDITYNAAKWPFYGIDVHPLTGDVMVGGGVGLWILKPPTGHPATTSIWGNLPNPVKELLPTTGGGSTLAFNALTNQTFTQGIAGSYDVSGRVSGGTAPYTFSMTPTGNNVTITSAGNITSTAASTSQAATTYTVEVEDALGNSLTRTLTITIEDQVTPPVDNYTVVNVSNSTQLRQALNNAGSKRYRIKLAAGNYESLGTLDKYTFTSTTDVIIESANFSNPANFNDSDPINLTNSSWITIRWINFHATTSNNTTGLRVGNCNNILCERLSFTGWREQFVVAMSDNVTYQYSTMTQSRMDFIRVFYHCTNILIYKIKAYNHFLANIGGEHRDILQVATNPNYIRNNRYGTTNLTVRSCIFVNDTIETKSESEGQYGAQSVQTYFIYNDILRVNSNSPYPTYGAQHLGKSKHINLLIEDCYGRGHNINGVALCGTEDAIVRRVVLRQADFDAQSGNATKMSVNFYIMKNAGGVAWNEDVNVNNVVIPTGHAFRRTTENDPQGTTGTALIGSGSITTNITTSNTAWPDNWPHATPSNETIANLNWAGRDAT